LTVRVPPQTLLQLRRPYSARAAKRSFPAADTTPYLNILTNAVTSYCRGSLLHCFHFRTMIWNSTRKRTAWQDGELVQMLAIKKTYRCDCLASVLPHHTISKSKHVQSFCLCIHHIHRHCLSAPPHRKTVRRKNYCPCY